MDSSSWTCCDGGLHGDAYGRDPLVGSLPVRSFGVMRHVFPTYAPDNPRGTVNFAMNIRAGASRLQMASQACKASSLCTCELGVLRRRLWREHDL